MRKWINSLIFSSIFFPIVVFAQIGQKPVYFSMTIPGTKSVTPIQRPNYEKYVQVDLYAKNAPEFDGNLSKLVDYLIKPYKKNDELKARVLFAWMVYHLNYDQFKANNLNGETRDGKPRYLNSGDAYKTRVGICGDFADLFVRMATRANLKAIRIDGVAGEKLTRETAPSAKHAWNAVRIGKKWQLLDVTWAMAGDYTIFEDMTKINDYKKAIRERRRHTSELTVPENRKLNNKWFLTPPEVMIETHFPNDVKWELLDEPITPREIFKKNEEIKETEKIFDNQPIKMVIPQ